jgi:hypothetical protein
MLEKADAAEMPEKADVEMAEKADVAVEKGDVLDTLESNLEARCTAVLFFHLLLPFHVNLLDKVFI